LKTRILFVDDESLALQGLQRLLRHMRTDWEMTFEDSASRALESMRHTPFDVVVTDMLMPGMNGAEFLNEVREHYPHTIRLVLSGHAEKELIFQCLGSAHQFLAKPCPPEMLKATLLRISSLNQSMQSNEGLRGSITRMDRFPSVPSLYIDLAETLLNVEVSSTEVTSIVLKDPGVTAATLKTVNSAFFGGPCEISDPADALSCLGLDTFKSLAFGWNAFSPFDAPLFKNRALDLLWHHSVDVAIAAKRIAEIESADKKTAAAAYVAGLLHDIGKFVMILYAWEQHRQAVALAKERNVPLGSAEQEVFGISHAETGAYLLGLWRLPPAIVDAVSLHHTPIQASSSHFNLLTAVHAANALVADTRGFAAKTPPPDLDLTYLAQVGLSSRIDAWREALRAEIGAMC
jgi:putative nucleotidyltransferase with HDIG domain